MKMFRRNVNYDKESRELEKNSVYKRSPKEMV